MARYQQATALCYFVVAVDREPAVPSSLAVMLSLKFVRRALAGRRLLSSAVVLSFEAVMRSP
jgi:hypothetical protein